MKLFIVTFFMFYFNSAYIYIVRKFQNPVIHPRIYPVSLCKWYVSLIFVYN